MCSGAGCTAGAAATGGASPAGGHGSPLGTRGSPRRSEVVPMVSVAGAGAGAGAGAAGGAAAGNVAAGTAGAAASAAGVVVAPGAGAPDGGITDTEISPAGGQGSPPGTRGRPRRSCRVPARPALTAGTGADTAVGPGAVSWEAAVLTGAGAAGIAAAGSGAASFTAERGADRAAVPAATTLEGAWPAGGQGSPPSTRGRPRRIDRDRDAITDSSEPQGR